MAIVPTGDFSRYPNASAKAGVEPKKKEEVIVDPSHIRLREPSAFTKFKNKLISGDAKDVKNYIIDDVIVPSLLNAVSDAVANGIDILLFGEARHSKSSSNRSIIGNRGGNYVSYNSISRPQAPMMGTGSIRNTLRLNDFIFDNRSEPTDILDRMSTILQDYGLVTVADLYDMCGLKSEYTYNNYVWKDLSTAGVSRVADGYLLNLPTPHTLD